MKKQILIAMAALVATGAWAAGRVQSAGRYVRPHGRKSLCAA